MKKLIVAILAVALMTISVGCNRTFIDTTYKFDQAIIYLPNGDIVEGRVESWVDFEDGDMIQVKIDGATYLTHSANVVLIAE